jgi:hypothetical protein
MFVAGRLTAGAADGHADRVRGNPGDAAAERQRSARRQQQDR